MTRAAKRAVPGGVARSDFRGATAAPPGTARARTTRLIAALALAATAACGVRSRPFPPELVHPEAPGALIAKSEPDGIRVTWRRPTKYSSGKRMKDLAGFDVERADGTDSIAFTKVGYAEVTDQTRFRPDRTTMWIDTSAVIGNTYRYRVVATTLDGYRSEPSESVTILHRPGTTGTAPPPTPPRPTPSKKKATGG